MAAVADAAAEPDDEDASAALRQQMKRALREDEELRCELAALLPRQENRGVTVTASGPRSIAGGGSIRVAITGDGHTAPER